MSSFWSFNWGQALRTQIFCHPDLREIPNRMKSLQTFLWCLCDEACRVCVCILMRLHVPSQSWHFMACPFTGWKIEFLIFPVGTNYHISCGIGRADMIYHYHGIVYMTVPCRNPLFRCIFQSHRCIQSALSLNFVKDGAPTHFIRLFSYSCISKVCMSPTHRSIQQPAQNLVAV